MPDHPRPQRDRVSLIWFLLLSAAINGAAVVSGYWIKFPERPIKADTVIELTDLDVNDVEKLGNPDVPPEAPPPEPEPTPPPPPPEQAPTPPPVDKPEFELPEPTPLPTPPPTPVPSVIPRVTPVPRPLATPKPPPKPPKPQIAAAKPVERPNPNAAATPGLATRGNPAGASNGTGHAGRPSSGAILLRSPKPPYPPQALQMGIRGDVRVQFTVSNGNIVDVRAISGQPILSSAVVRWTRANWKFAPGANGTFTLPVTFQMQ
ncbi:MAG: TonB family protein [Verrucomicrobia bacterium]|nr:TonB family protein [Verrucomicrobiota bacterium]